MKKLLLTTAAITIISSASAFAESGVWFLKANVGGGHVNEFKDRETSLKLKSENHLFFGLGVGYYLMDNIRVDFTIDHHVYPELRKTGTVTGITDNVTARHRANIDSLLVNGLVDVFEFANAKLYTGVGVGVVQIKEKVTKAGFGSGNAATNIGRKTNITYALYLGATTQLAPSVHGDLSYSWRDFGKTKVAKATNGVEVGRSRYKGHHVSIGVRFDM